MGMTGVDKIGEIRRAYFEQDRSIKEIVRTLLVSRATVRKVIRGHKTEFKYARGVQPKGLGVLAPGLNSPHAQKPLSKNSMIPDRLLPIQGPVPVVNSIVLTVD
jgi:hypothetical protein